MRRLVCLCLLLACDAACGDDAAPGGPADAAASADAGPDAPPADAPPPDAPPADAGPTLLLSGTVVALDPLVALEQQAPIAGAMVCRQFPAGGACVATDAAGAWSMTVPQEAALRLRVSAAGHAPVLHLVPTGAADATITTYLPLDAAAADFFAGCGATWPDPQKAAIWLTFSAPPAGAQATLNPSMSGVGPCYMGAPFVHDAMQTETSAGGRGMVTFGGVFSADGDIDALVAAPGMDCASAGHRWDTPQPGGVRVPIALGTITALEIVCAP
jgi:hypothetical protein